MPPKHASNRKKPERQQRISDPETMLAAAEKAPSVFNISSYFRALYVMRQKGYSWRDLESWAAKFGINISAVHLRRLYVQENARLAAKSAEELRAQGCPDEMIADILRKDDPTERLTAQDPEDAALEAKRRKAALEFGVPQDYVDQADLSHPIKLGDQTI